MIKCPACGATTSSKRQICHMCGHLLNEKASNDGLKKESLDLVSDDLKAAAEAALRELGRGPQKSSDRPATPEIPTGPPEKPAAPQSKAPAKKIAGLRPRTRNNREKLILIGSGLITAIALVSILLGAFRPHGSSSSSENASATGGISSPDASGIPQTGTLPTLPGTETALPEPTSEIAVSPAGDETSGNSEALNLEDLRAGISAVLTRINSDLGTNFPSSHMTLTPSVSEQDNAQLLVQVAVQGNGFAGSVTALFRSYDFGWRQGWQLTHYQDLTINFASPVTVNSNTEAGTVRRSVSAAQVGAGALEPVTSLAGSTVQYQ